MEYWCSAGGTIEGLGRENNEDFGLCKWQIARICGARLRKAYVGALAPQCEKLKTSDRAVGVCREAATQYSPGLQPWVRRSADPP